MREREKRMKVVGFMSGTSADGIDVALCEIQGEPPHIQATILHGTTIPYERTMRQLILMACSLEHSNVREICMLNADIGEWFSKALIDFLKETPYTLADIDLIGSHGQTIWHEVQNGKVFATLQIGEASIIAERTNITTIHNFRARDVAAGGQGAPLTAYADWLLLRHPERWRAVQNIGGMGNVTFLPPLTYPHDETIAFDTGAGNALIDMAVYTLTQGALTYDEDGWMALSAMPNEDWLDRLMQHPYYRQVPPKTTGRETFGTAYAQQLVQEGLVRGLSPEEIVATLTMLTATSIAQAYTLFAPHPIEEIILGGGGKNNAALVRWLEGLLSIPVLTHEDIGIDSKYKEALVFALLAYETWHNRPATLPSQTGARHASVLGQITPAGNYTQLLKRTYCL
jgi:anhydro-N-acetylmuramic acid kinase